MIGFEDFGIGFCNFDLDLNAQHRTISLSFRLTEFDTLR